MKIIQLGASGLAASRLACGCWRMADRAAGPGAGRRAVLAAVEAGYTLFDHADIYCDGEAFGLSREEWYRLLEAAPGQRLP